MKKRGRLKIYQGRDFCPICKSPLERGKKFCPQCGYGGNGNILTFEDQEIISRLLDQTTTGGGHRIKREGAEFFLFF